MTISIQKANFWKRFSAWLFDTVLLVFATISLVLALGSVLGVSAKAERYAEKIEEHSTAIEAEFDIDFEIKNSESYEEMDEEERAAYDELYQAANDELSQRIKADSEAVAIWNGFLRSLFLSVSLSLVLSHFIFNFTLPLFLKNGQTLGKKMLGLCVVRTNAVKISPVVLFTRQIVGGLLIETMVVLFMCTLIPVGLITALLVQILQIYLILKTPTHSLIHDLIADTVVVDFQSQRIFDSQQEMEEFIARSDGEATLDTGTLSAQNAENEEKITARRPFL